jgi:hypothetical protein
MDINNASGRAGVASNLPDEVVTCLENARFVRLTFDFQAYRNHRGSSTCWLDSADLPARVHGQPARSSRGLHKTLDNANIAGSR